MTRALHLCVLLFFCSLPLSAQELRIFHIDMEQASATLFVAPGGKTLLVDSGKNGMGGRIKKAMDRANVTVIDFFVLTHYHEDHNGGIDDLIRLSVPVREAFDRGDKLHLAPAKLKERTFQNYQAALGEDARQLRRGMIVPLDPMMTVTCISSGGLVIGGDSVTGRDENDMSVSLLITFGSFRYFIGGDIEARTEKKIADLDLVQDVDVYVADHHGSDTSSIVPFLQDLTPHVIIVSNGDSGQYHHPRLSTLTSYTQLRDPPAVFQTNKCLKGPPCGNVANTFIADPESTGQDGTILLTADIATLSYSVAFDSGVSLSFPFRIRPAGNTLGFGAVVIDSLLPNPSGDDAQLEEVTLKNKGVTPASLAGWTLQDRSNLSWPLSGSIVAGGSRTFRRKGMAMTLNNNGDEIRLIDAANVEKDRFEYAGSTESAVIQSNH